MTFFQGQMAFTRCILFTRFTREQNTTCKGHLAFQKVIYSRESALHSFFDPNIHSFYYECRKGTVLHLYKMASPLILWPSRRSSTGSFYEFATECTEYLGGTVK